MVDSTKCIHPANIRKRIYQKHEQYPHPDKLKRIVDKLIYCVGIFGQVMTISQLSNIWIEKNAAGVSAIS